MKCNVNVFPTNYPDWARFQNQDWSTPPDPSDHSLLREAMNLVDVIDDLGFDNIWCTEHHVTPYGLSPNPITFLAHVAGRTRNVGVGTGVIVVPWWKNPMRAAEELSMLDNLLDGRDLSIGFGRGIAVAEYSAMGVDREESRGRFAEGVEIIRLALSQERFSFHGEFFEIPETTMRPRPLHSDLADRMYGAFTSEGSLAASVELGLGMLFSGGKALDVMKQDVARFNTLRAERGLEPTQPIVNTYMLLSEDQAVLDKARESWWPHMRSEMMLHYGFNNPSQFKGVKGYEAYFDAAAAGASEKSAFGRNDDLEFLGKPDVIGEELLEMVDAVGAQAVNINFIIADVPADVVETSVRLFAEKVMPTLKQHESILTPELVGS
jgi:alkanesulfonate monooxygenase SsuD/methylene tetrahydromethanopterin reductase-like flavin-dependent oxidoreductase (luciferase family)